MGFAESICATALVFSANEKTQENDFVTFRVKPLKFRGALSVSLIVTAGCM
jgi:hypothetical protein